MTEKHPLLIVPPGERGRHFEQAALLILERRNWQTSPNDRIEIITLRHSFRVDVLGEIDGKPVRHATFSETTSAAAIELASTIRQALGGWPIDIPPLVLRECGR